MVPSQPGSPDQIEVLGAGVLGVQVEVTAVRVPVRPLLDDDEGISSRRVLQPGVGFPQPEAALAKDGCPEIGELFRVWTLHRDAPESLHLSSLRVRAVREPGRGRGSLLRSAAGAP